MKEFDKLWNYNDPAATEVKFREALPNYDATTDLSGYLQLLTQIARTYSLRMMFDEAHSTLDEVQKQLPAATDVAHIRYYLERGRTFNSAGKKAEATEQFILAKDAAIALKEDFYAIDAVHMLAIAAPTDEAIKLNEAAVILAEQSTQERAKNWLGSLYNNLGWSYFDKGEYEKALSIFLRALQWREEKQSAPQIFLAKWCIARTLRALNRLDEALKIQLGLLEEMVDNDNHDGYVYEELGEIYLLKNEEVYKMYFGFAHTHLSKDIWLTANEAPRLERLLQLSK